MTWQELKGGKKRKEEFQSWRRNPPWENSQTEQTALVGIEQDWAFFVVFFLVCLFGVFCFGFWFCLFVVFVCFFLGKFKMWKLKRESPCSEDSEDSASVP